MAGIKTLIKSFFVLTITYQPTFCGVTNGREATVKMVPHQVNNQSYVSSLEGPGAVFGHPRCGGNFSSPTGGIFYKPFDTLLDNERCVWIINANSAKGYKLDIQYLGDKTNSEEEKRSLLMISSFRHGGMGSPEGATYFPSTAGKFSVPDCNTIVVTLATPFLHNTTNTGFVIQYETLFTGNANATGVSRGSTQRIVQPSQLEFKYPSSDGYYRRYYFNHEFSSFAVVPDNNIYTESEIPIWYKKDRLEGTTCFDSLFVYKLNLTKLNENRSPWDGTGRLCGNVSTANLSHDDVVLLFLQTDMSVTDTGFTLMFPRESPSSMSVL